MEAIRVFRPKLGPILSQTKILSACKLSRFPLTSFPGKLAHIVPLKATSNTLACEDEKNNRKFKKLGPSEWGHHFLSAHVDSSEMGALGKEIEALKPKVKNVFMSSKGMKTKILFIYLLVTLGVAYHFEDEIEESLRENFQKIEEMMAGEDDLYTVSIIFYVFRTYGYNISSDVFGRFQGDKGKFKECLTRDAKGILSLYEAAHMGTTTDYILDEAMSFTSSYLESLAASGTCKLNLLSRIRNALDQPQHKNMEIIVAMQYIPLYEQEENCDKMLLKFAKLNFKFLQLQYLEELKILSKWYKEQDFESKLPPYYRDRFVEMHLMALTYFEPKYSRVRIMLTKLFTVQIIIDDTCDRYASLREVESLANTLERWDPDDHHAMDEQQDYLKFVVKFIFDTFQEYERELVSEFGGSYSVKATIESCKTLVRANLQLARWAGACHVPTFEEYLDVAGIEIAVYFTLAGTLMAMENICKEEAYEWLESRDKLVRLLCTKMRLLNDMFGFEDDMSRGYVTGSVNCYKKQYAVTKEETFSQLHQMVADVDKMMNEEFLKTINVPDKLLNVVMDCLRSINVAYVTDDEFTRPSEKLKSYITSLYVDL